VFGFDNSTLQYVPNSFAGRIDGDMISSIVKKYSEPTFQCDVSYVISRDGNEHPIVVVPAHGPTPICAKANGPMDGKKSPRQYPGPVLSPKGRTTKRPHSYGCRMGSNNPAMPGVFPDYPAPVVRNADNRPRADNDALGRAVAAAHGRAAGHQYPQHIIAALARMAEAGKPVLGPSEQLR
jgi:hypothetical protein